jgi:valyl-tRNA synthetase
LYTALENALTMIHPFMPFLTEELWQRLPRRPSDETRSIVVASYPQYDAQLDDPTSESAYELILGCSKGVRSLIQEYSVKENGKAFVQPLTEDAYATASKEAASIKVLSGKYLSELTVLKANETIPVPAAAYPVSGSVAVFLEIPGDVDAGREIEKAKPKLQKTAGAVREQQKLISTLGDKVGDEVKALEDQKLRDLLSEQKVFEQSIERFEQMKL